MNIPKLKQSFNTEYKVCQDGKTIVCYVTPTNDMPYLWFLMYTNENRNTFNHQTQQFKGVARFKEGDNFDVEIGKKIAKKKAMRAYFQHLRGQYLPILKEFLNFVNQRLAFMSQVDEKVEILTNEIKELTK